MAYAERAGFDANLFSDHSLRSGFLTSAAANGASIFKMTDVSRHKSVDTLPGYVRDAELFKDHAGSRLTVKRILRLYRGGTGILRTGKTLGIGTALVQRVVMEQRRPFDIDVAEVALAPQ